MMDDHGLGRFDSRRREALADNTSFPPMHLFVNAIMGVVDGRKVWMRGVARGLLSVSPLAIYICHGFSKQDKGERG